MSWIHSVAAESRIVKLAAHFVGTWLVEHARFDSLTPRGNNGGGDRFLLDGHALERWAPRGSQFYLAGNLPENMLENMS